MRPGCTIEVVPLQAEHACTWKQFLQASNNGTLFHDLDFLAYHPPARFESHHLLFRQGGQILALLPAVVVAEGTEQRYLKSHDGASVGGFVLPLRQSAGTTLALVERLQNYVCLMELDGIEMRIAPSIYSQKPDDQLGFALAAQGFQLVRRWLTQVLQLPPTPDGIPGLFSSRKSRYIRSALRKGIVLQEVGPELLGRFYHLLCRNLDKYGAVPTHTLPELQTLFERVSHALRLFACLIQGELVGGALVFELNARVALVFYLCHEQLYEAYQVRLCLATYLARAYTVRQFRYLDLGPSTFDDFRLNRGAAWFKEGLGARGYCRDTWTWKR